jgi:hypothetical protein
MKGIISGIYLESWTIDALICSLFHLLSPGLECRDGTGRLYAERICEMVTSRAIHVFGKGGEGGEGFFVRLCLGLGGEVDRTRHLDPLLLF